MMRGDEPFGSRRWRRDSCRQPVHAPCVDTQGNRPSYIRAARPETAVPLYRDFIDRLNEALPKPCGEGEFGADMQVALVNDGPVTIIIDSHLKE